jgi:hypothetical protein
MIRQQKQFSTVSTIFAFGLLFITVSLVTMVRSRFRAKFAIPGDGCNDCCCSFWCQCCVIAQVGLARGLRGRETANVKQVVLRPQSQMLIRCLHTSLSGTKIFHGCRCTVT